MLHLLSSYNHALSFRHCHLWAAQPSKSHVRHEVVPIKGRRTSMPNIDIHVLHDFDDFVVDELQTEAPD